MADAAVYHWIGHAEIKQAVGRTIFRAAERTAAAQSIRRYNRMKMRRASRTETETRVVGGG